MVDDNTNTADHNNETLQKEKNRQNITRKEESPLLPIEILYSDEDIVVVNKPCNLRSVPGHAATVASAKGKGDRSDNQQKNKKRRLFIEDNNNDKSKVKNVMDVGEKKRIRRTAQEAWMESVQSFRSVTINDILSLLTIDKNDNHPNNKTNNNDNNSVEEMSPPPSSTTIESVQSLLNGLAGIDRRASIPRKLKLFQNYIQRNTQTISPRSNGSNGLCISYNVNRSDNLKQPDGFENSKEVMEIAHLCIQKRQRPLLNLPTPTKDEESVYGQLKLLGFGNPHYNYASNMNRINRTHSSKHSVDKYNHDYSSNDNKFTTCRMSNETSIFVVHRLDCQTSGLMVFARNQESASILSKSWRCKSDSGNKDSHVSSDNFDNAVQKIYWAQVRRWPPYQTDGIEQGCIDLPLVKSSERLKWKVAVPIPNNNSINQNNQNDSRIKNSHSGKASRTLWKILSSQLNKNEEKADISTVSASSGCTPSANSDLEWWLELTPITGRTHQLRVHCAAIGSGIDGDTLYGDDPIEWDANKDPIPSTNLKLHAYKLSFPHPKTRERMTFQVHPKHW